MISKCLEWLKREEFKHELKEVLTPVMLLLLETIKPYLLYGIAFILLNFILLASILICVLRFRKNILTV